MDHRNKKLKAKSEIKNHVSRNIDLSNTNLRFVLLFFISFLCFGSFFISDTPKFIMPLLDYDSTNFSLIFLIYYFPNIILSLVSGYLIDKLHIQYTILLFSSLALGGHLVFVVGIMTNSYFLVLLGRGISGIGGENLVIAKSLMIIKWFKGKELSMAIGITISCSRLGTFLSTNLVPVLLETFPIWNILTLGIFFCLISVVFGIFTVKIDAKRENCEKHSKLYKDNEETIWKNFLNLKIVYWVLIVNYVVVNSSIFCVCYLSNYYIKDRFQYTSTESGFISSLIYVSLMIFAPISGYISDRYVKREYLLFLSSFIITSVHILFLFTPNTPSSLLPIFYFFLLGIGYSIFITIFWTCVSFVVNPKFLGIAFGIGYSFNSIGICIAVKTVELLSQDIAPETGFHWINTLLVGLGEIGIVCSMIILAMTLEKNKFKDAISWDRSSKKNPELKKLLKSNQNGENFGGNFEN